MADTHTTAFERIVAKYRYAKLPRPQRPWRLPRMQFSLKALLLLVTVAAMVFAAVVAANRAPPPKRPYVLIQKHIDTFYTRSINYWIYFDGKLQESYSDAEPLGTLNQVAFRFDHIDYYFKKNEPLYKQAGINGSNRYGISLANAIRPEMEQRYKMLLAHVGHAAEKLRWGQKTRVYLPMDYERPDPKLFLPPTAKPAGVGSTAP